MSKMYYEVKKYIPERHMFDVMEYFKEKKVSFNFNNFKSSKTLKLKIHRNENLSDVGGKNESKNIVINIKIYEYYDGYSKSISFVKINSIFNNNNDDYNENDTQEKYLSDFSGAHQKFDNKFLEYVCGIILMDENNNVYINSIVNYQDCIKCFENKKFNIGEILFRIMISICIFKQIKKIHLTDNSYLNCGNDKIPLIYLRTITKGKPYYTKFGFYPIDHNINGENEYYKNELQIYRDNIDTFNANPAIKKNKLIKIFNYQKFDEIKDKKMIDYLNNILIPYIDDLKSNNIQIKDLVLFMIKDKKKIPCLLLMNILMPLYYKCGYKQYNQRHFEFIVEKNFRMKSKNI